MASYNGLSEAEEERAALFIEENGEGLQAIGKVIRHGYESFNPFDPDKITNRTTLTKEVGDMLIAIELMLSAGDIDPYILMHHIRQKVNKMRPYIHCEENLDALPHFTGNEFPFVSLRRHLSEGFEYLGQLGYVNKNEAPIPCPDANASLPPLPEELPQAAFT